MSRYASETKVSVAKSKSEIEETLLRYGCSGFMSGWKGDQAMIAFQVNERQIKFLLPMPERSSDEFRLTGRGRVRSRDDAFRAWHQGCRQRWRALALAIKAKLEVVECGIVTFDQEFLAYIVAADGRTVGQQIIPMIEQGKLPQLCLTGGRELEYSAQS